MPDAQREIRCPLCGGRMVRGKEKSENPQRGRMAWSSQGEYAEAKTAEPEAEKESAPAEKGDRETFRCLYCSAILIGPDRWS